MNDRLPKITGAKARLSALRKVTLLVLLASTLGVLWVCTSTDDIVYKLYPGLERPDTEIVTLKLGSASEVIIDGLKVDRAIMALCPCCQVPMRSNGTPGSALACCLSPRSPPYGNWGMPWS